MAGFELDGESGVPSSQGFFFFRFDLRSGRRVGQSGGKRKRIAGGDAHVFPWTSPQISAAKISYSTSNGFFGFIWVGRGDVDDFAPEAVREGKQLRDVSPFFLRCLCEKARRSSNFIPRRAGRNELSRSSCLWSREGAALTFTGLR